MLIPVLFPLQYSPWNFMTSLRPVRVMMFFEFMCVASFQLLLAFLYLFYYFILDVWCLSTWLWLLAFGFEKFRLLGLLEDRHQEKGTLRRCSSVPFLSGLVFSCFYSSLCSFRLWLVRNVSFCYCCCSFSIVVPSISTCAQTLFDSARSIFSISM